MKKLKRYYRKHALGRTLLSPLKWCYDFFWVRLVPEKLYLKHFYKIYFFRTLNLDDPKTIQEKYLWLRLHEKTQLRTLCSDKYQVRKYIKEKIGEQYLVPLVLHTKNPKDITIDRLPNYPVIIKTNHACGGHTVVKDKNIVCYRKLHKDLKKALNQNFYYKSRQWQYKNIPPRIIVEKLLIDNDNKQLHDYKIHCYNGNVIMIEVYLYNNHIKNINFYDTKWNKLDIRCRTLKNDGIVDKPMNLTKMISIAEKLSSEFRFVRVDMYNIAGKIYIGELTFTPAMGLQGYFPEKWSITLGNKLNL